jgi:hypothetical protein
MQKAFPLRGRGTAAAVDEGVGYIYGKDANLKNKSIFPGKNYILSFIAKLKYYYEKQGHTP